MDFETIVADVEGVLDEAKSAVGPIEALAGVIAPFLPAVQAQGILASLTLIKALVENAPKIVADAKELQADISKVLSVLTPAAPSAPAAKAVVGK